MTARAPALLLLLLPACARCDPRPAEAALQVATVDFGGHVVHAELAVDPATQERGLKLRRRLSPDEGMLFVLPEHSRVQFWMEDTFLPLSIAFLDEDGRILTIEDMEPFDTTTRHVAPDSARYALEVGQGWFDDRGIGPGARAALRVPLGGYAP